MIATRKHIPRRQFLRGLGAVIALPMLDAMVPAAFGQSNKLAAGKSPLRLSFVYVPNGIVMDHWTPAAEGSKFELPGILQPLAPFRDQLTVISGLTDHQADALGDGGGDHARAGASYLTGSHPRKTGGSDIYAGVSADQVAAQHIGQQTRLPSIEIGLDDNRTVGHCDSGYSCAYTNSISWQGPSTPLPPEANPRLLFERLFGDFDPSVSAETRARRAIYRKSILDSATDETSKLMGQVGAADQHKLDEYLTTIREVEKRIEQAENSPHPADPKMEKPSGIPSDFAEHAKILYDLQALAFQADLTRVATMMIGREGSVRTYEQIGVPDPHHPLSHHRNLPEALAKLTKINTYPVELFTHFLDKLKSTQDGDGTLLDHSMIVYGCGISDSNQHLHYNLPVLLTGGGGALQGNRHISVADNTPVTNLYLSLLDKMNVQVDALGDSTGKLEI
jgi:hypothetical protein